MVGAGGGGRTRGAGSRRLLGRAEREPRAYAFSPHGQSGTRTVAFRNRPFTGNEREKKYGGGVKNKTRFSTTGEAGAAERVRVIRAGTDDREMDQYW